MLYNILTVFVFFFIYRFHDVPLGIFAETVAKLRLLPEVHQMVKPGKGCFQVGRLQSGVQALGRTQEQTRHELRDDGTCSQVRIYVNMNHHSL